MSNTNYELGYHCDKITDKFFIFTFFTGPSIPETIKKKMCRMLKRILKKEGITAVVNFQLPINKVQDVRVVVNQPENVVKAYVTKEDLDKQQKTTAFSREKLKTDAFLKIDKKEEAKAIIKAQLENL